MRQVLAVVGDYYHDGDILKEALEKVFTHPLLAGRYELKFAETEQLAEALQGSPACVILSKENRLDPAGNEKETWMTNETAELITDYVKGGGGWLAWHSGLASYKNVASFNEMLRGAFEHHPEKHQQVTYTPVHGESGGNAFAILDEHYFVSYEEDSTEVFLVSESVDGNSIAGWRHPYGDGRVSCFTPAHRKEGLMDNSVQNVLAENIVWCSKAVHK
ncbi:ThuA domain-containing protein [Mesobacillus foraminis]|uniref:Trehalose utilization protein n=1 Tax=Mesobacillus foraminis TaxID=279826 RepID=A0A4R2BBE9_9BACI|nr:ThuA domain-containing protein [Mesobacillus foraminis]TCN24228.1 trehalose utilization protein [Mesobacillus foraminis]